MVLALVAKSGTVLARSVSRSFLERKQKTITQRTKIIDLDKLTSKERATFIRQSKVDKRLQKRWSVKSKAQRLFRHKLTSSFVEYLSWNKETGDVKTILSGKKYTFRNVPEGIFVAWTKGAATCTTSDSGKKKEWWIGKTPSLGAFFNTYIKPKYGFIHGWVD